MHHGLPGGDDSEEAELLPSPANAGEGSECLQPGGKGAKLTAFG